MSFILDGVSQYATGALVAANDEGSFSIWVKSINALGAGQILVDTDPARHQFQHTNGAPGGPGYYIDGATANAGIVQVHNVWRHYALTYKKSTATIVMYVDGAEAASVLDGAWGATADGTQITLGARYSQDAAFFKGRIAEFAYYDIELSAPQVATLAGGALASAVQPANLLGYWHLDTDLVPTVGAVTLTNGDGSGFDGADNPAVGGPLAYTLAGAAGSFSMTGVDVAFSHGYHMAAAAGSFSRTGVAAASLRDYVMHADAGSFAVTGLAARGVEIIRPALMKLYDPRILSYKGFRPLRTPKPLPRKRRI